MKIISSKRIQFLVHSIFEKYYEPIQKELDSSGLVEDFVYKIKQEIVAIIYRKAMDAEIETEEELDAMATAIINEHLEQVLVPYYMQIYIEKFSLDKVILENGMLTGIQENNNGENREQQEIQPVFREKTNKNILEPEKENPEPEKENPEPEKENPEPEKKNPEPEKENPEPEKENPEPEKENPEPEKENPEPEKENPEPEKKNPEPELEEEPASKQEYQAAFEVKMEETELVKEETTSEEQENIEILNFLQSPQQPTIVRRVEEPKIRRFRINWVLTVLLSLLSILVLWVVIGMLMGRGYIPKLDIGYTWFNKYIWSIF